MGNLDLWGDNSTAAISGERIGAAASGAQKAARREACGAKAGRGQTARPKQSRGQSGKNALCSQRALLASILWSQTPNMVVESAGV